MISVFLLKYSFIFVLICAIIFIILLIMMIFVFDEKWMLKKDNQ
jgi:hypothetical protein